MKLKERKGVWEATAGNGRFGVMAAVTLRTILCGNECLHPAGSLVEAATTPSRWDVTCNGGATVWRTMKRKIES